MDANDGPLDGGAGAGSQGSQGEEMTDDDILNIMVSTDNHVGFMEKDPVRRDDSFLAFEEVLTKARESKADLVFLAGDLYHENQPSRATEFRTVEILRKAVMSYDPVAVQVLSDQSAVLTSSHAFNRVNWEDPHYNVGLPVFAIHGNHDDPVREGDHVLAPLDVLSAANLVNYIGKADTLTHVTLAPLLLRKGKTKVALYGLGNIRDDRFSRLLVNNQVTFRRPAADPDSYFSVFLIHQNRDNRTMRNRSSIPHFESFLPPFIDLVVWGHEHECKPEAQQTIHKQRPVAAAAGDDEDDGDDGGEGGARRPKRAELYDAERATFILQPGSTVATSLTEGEARDKHAFLLRVRGSQFKVEPQPLRCVRPFVMAEVSLSDAKDSGVTPDAPDALQQVERFLKKKVTALVRAAKEALAARPPELRPPPGLEKPLVRLKVEHSGFHTLPNARFGSAFADHVANPGDILLFWRRPKPRAQVTAAIRKSAAAASSSSSAAADGSLGPVAPQELASITLEDLVLETLQGAKLQVLRQGDMAYAFRSFLDGKGGALREEVDERLKRAMGDFADDVKATTAGSRAAAAELVSSVEAVRERTAAVRARHERMEAGAASEEDEGQQAGGSDGDGGEGAGGAASTAAAKKKAGAAAAGGKKGAAAAAGGNKAAGGPTRAEEVLGASLLREGRGAGAGAGGHDDGDDDGMGADDVGGADGGGYDDGAALYEEDDGYGGPAHLEEDEMMRLAGGGGKKGAAKGRGAAAPKAPARGRAAASSAAAAGAKRGRKQRGDSDEDDDDGASFGGGGSDDGGGGGTSSRGSSVAPAPKRGRAAAAKKPVYAEDDDGDEDDASFDDEDDYDGGGGGAGGKKKAAAKKAPAARAKASPAKGRKKAAAAAPPKRRAAADEDDDDDDDFGDVEPGDGGGAHGPVDDYEGLDDEEEDDGGGSRAKPAPKAAAAKGGKGAGGGGKKASPAKAAAAAGRGRVDVDLTQDQDDSDDDDGGGGGAPAPAPAAAAAGGGGGRKLPFGLLPGGKKK